MAFKTDTIKLNHGYTSDPTGTDGELAVVGNAGNRVLKLYDDGAWADVSASAGGGAAELNELSDVLSSPSTENHVAFVTLDAAAANAPKLEFGFLSIDMIGSDTLDTGVESSDLNTTIMSSLAIKNKIEGYAYSTDSNFNHVQNTNWGNNLHVMAGNSAQTARTDNLTWVNTVNPEGNELIVYNPSTYASYAKITIMNASTFQMIFTKDLAANPPMQFHCMQNDPTLSDNITLEAFQKAILIRTSSDNWEVIIASI